jgi:predicted HicB family RNase H-like nuclease
VDGIGVGCYSPPMTNTMTHNGYSARIEYDDADGVFFGRIAGIRDGVTFHARHGGGLC